ncbi:proteasome assembly chaperone 4 [Ambystoma mexicanum]|uniref:proteasome assembly chaperone 4 n=1 Tax=Ambystoma mexicanum TaxID=8296 RepID=UPI0037E8E8E1
MVEPAKEGCSPVTLGISLHNFCEKLGEVTVHFHVMRLADGFFLWVGSTASLSSMAVAMCSRYDSIPVATCILGDASDTTSCSFAQRLVSQWNVSWGHLLLSSISLSASFLLCPLLASLGLLAKQDEGESRSSSTASALNNLSQAKKTKKQVFVSYNLPSTDANFALLVENRVKKEMEAFPEKF